jgi:hypothetical protein
MLDNIKLNNIKKQLQLNVWHIIRSEDNICNVFTEYFLNKIKNPFKETHIQK